MTPISGLVITLNEAHNITDCIRSMKRICDDIVVVDSGSTDGTIELAREHGALVIVQKPFLGDGPQRSLGLPHCRHQWVLNLDADERLEDDFVDYVKKTDLDALGVDLVETRRHNLLGGRFTPYAGQYPDYVKRLFNRTQADFKPVVAHSHVEANSSIKVPVHITHYSYRDYPRSGCQKPVFGVAGERSGGKRQAFACMAADSSRKLGFYTALSCSGGISGRAGWPDDFIVQGNEFLSEICSRH